MQKKIQYPLSKHVLFDLWGAEGLTDGAFIEVGLRQAAATCGATVLEVKLHHFGGEAGVTGVAVLAESHISIHTWPEYNYAALDIFVCGNCDAEQAAESLKQHFKPEKFKILTILRGVDN